MEVSSPLSFIKPIAFEISRNVIFGGVSILGLGLFTYLAKRYLNTDNKTTNQYYTKSCETMQMPNLTLTDNKHNRQNIIYVFWNGDISSSYLLVDLLLQDKIIQPLYVEKYTILKALEYNNLEKLTKQYIANTNANAKISGLKDTTTNAKISGLKDTTANAKISGLKDTTANAKIKQYLEDIARIKKNQINEMTQLEIFRKIILNQYPEFQSNLLPTIYITTIAKDLEYTLNFFSILKEISPLYYNGIEFLEQITRFIKYYKPINEPINEPINKTINKTNPRILIAYTKDSININLINKILISNKLILDNKIEIPLKDIDNKNIMFLASNLPNDIIKYFK
jgi:hypothetical protein